jgi:hypothetical protein
VTGDGWNDGPDVAGPERAGAGAPDSVSPDMPDNPLVAAVRSVVAGGDAAAEQSLQQAVRERVRQVKSNGGLAEEAVLEVTRDVISALEQCRLGIPSSNFAPLAHRVVTWCIQEFYELRGGAPRR